MSINTIRVHGAFILFLFLLAGCSGENGGEWGRRDDSKRDNGMEDSDIRIVLCPKSGGKVKFLSLDSLQVIRSDIEMPAEIKYLGNTPSSSGFAALGEDKVYIVSFDGGSEPRSVGLPSLSQDVLIVPSREGMLILDRSARRLIDVNLREGSVALDRTVVQNPVNLHYFPSEDKIALVMSKGTRGVVSVLSTDGDESMTINLDTILCTASDLERGRVYLATYGRGGARLEAFQIEDLSRVYDISLDRSPGSIIHAPGSKKLYMYFPQSGLIKAVDIEKGSVVSEIPLEGTGAGRFFSDDTGTSIYLHQEETGLLTIVRTKTDMVAGVIESDDADSRLVTTPDSRLILLQDKGGSRIRIYDGESLQLLRVFMEERPMTIGLLRYWRDEPETREIVTSERSQAETVTAGREDIISHPETVVEETELLTLQIFSSDDLSSSERVFGEVVLKGFPASIEEAVVVGKGTWFRVRVGEFTSREDAETVGEYLQYVVGLDYWITALENKGHADDIDVEAFLQGQDMDSDGYPEVAVIGSDGVVHLYTLRGYRYIPRWTFALPAEQVLCGSITYTDENGDGLPEAMLPLCPLDRLYMIAWNGLEFQGDAG